MFGENQLVFTLDPRFELDTETLILHLGSKIHALGSTILKSLLILVQNKNFVRKSHGLIWPILEITSLNVV